MVQPTKLAFQVTTPIGNKWKASEETWMQVRAQEERHEKTGTEGEGPVVRVGETIYQEPPERSALL